MKICICSSLTFADEVLEIGKMLEASGHEVLLPNGIINRLAEQPNFDPVRAKIDTDSNRLHADKIRECDAVLMCNFLKNCIPGYIGANCFAELYLAQYFKKPIFALFPLPDFPYINDEIRSFGITVLNNDLNLLPPESGMMTSVEPEPKAPIAPEGKPANNIPMPAKESLTESNSSSIDLGAPEAKMPIPADPMALPPNPANTSEANNQNRDIPAMLTPAPRESVAPITSGDVQRGVPNGAESKNPLKQVRDSWFSIWNKH